MRISPLMMLMIAGCSPEPPPAVKEIPPAEKLALPGIENAFRVTPMLFSGGAPANEAAFAELQKLGIRTIISVDGMTPDVALAEQFGMRYVHLPVGYGGIPTATALKLAKAVQTLPGPVFIHCHHGQHRGPAAVAAVRLCLEQDYTPYFASLWLQQAGTDPKYQGLIKLPTTLPRPAPAQLAAIPADFPAQSPATDLTKVMLSLDQHLETVKAANAEAWRGADAAATLMIEDFREARRCLATPIKGRDFKHLMDEAESAAETMAQAIRQGRQKDAAAAMSKLQSLCTQCHSSFRD